MNQTQTIRFMENVDIPGQAEFIAAMENKIGNLLGSKLTGQFKMLVAPEGFHYGFTYGNNGYYNKNSLLDIDRILTVDASSNQLGFGIQPFSVLYGKILADTGYHLSNRDQEKMNQADIVAQAYTKALIQAFKNDFPNIPLPAETSAVATIFQYIATTFGSIDNVPVYYRDTKNALMDYSVNAAESYQMHSVIANAQRRLQSLIGNINNPTVANSGLQTDASSFYVGYQLPDFAQTYSALTTDSNCISISLVFDQFNQQSSRLSIDHQAGFVIPLSVCVFGSSDTKYTLNSLVTSTSTVSMEMQFKGITTIAPSPVLTDATAATGWYDEEILSEIVRNTGNDSTGYCLLNEEFDVKSLFGLNGTFSRLKEYVICQAPVITIAMNEIDTSTISSLFKHDSQIDIDFFGFGISSSKHSYTVENIEINSQSRSVVITLGAPKPSPTVSVETEVAYVLGGVPSYPPSALTAAPERFLPLTFKLPKLWNGASDSIPVLYKNIKLLPGAHTLRYYLGKVPSFINADEQQHAVLSLWYYYIPSENTLWLSDQDDLTSDRTRIILYGEDNQVAHIMTNHAGADEGLSQHLVTFMETLIHDAEKLGLSIVRRRELPDDMKELYYHQGNGRYKALRSTYLGTRWINGGSIFANASGTGGDHFYDQNGTRVNASWLSLWASKTMQQATNCVNCNSTSNLCGAHILPGAARSITPAQGTQVHIIPLCSKCNNYHNTGQMTAAFGICSMVMIW